MSSPSPVVPPGQAELEPPGQAELVPPGEAELDPHPQPQPQKIQVNVPVIHKTKTLVFGGRRTPIVCQERDGACSLLAVCNVLLLNDSISLDPDSHEVSQEKLISLVADLLPPQHNERNKQYLRSLGEGLNADLRFRSIDDFVKTPQHAMISELYIQLYHGWIVDSEDHQTAAAIGGMTHDELLLEMVKFDTARTHKGQDDIQGDGILIDESPSADTIMKWELISDFLGAKSINQMSEHGLSCLRKQVPENVPCIFFRNSHFNTMIQNKGKIYLLVTAEAYRPHNDLMWQSLDGLSEPGDYFTSNFTPWNEQEAVMIGVQESAQFDSSTCGNIQMFDAAAANTFIINRDWVKLDAYLEMLLKPIHQTPYEVHPGLFMIPRKERLLDLISYQRLDEAADFYQNSIEPLRGLHGRFAPFNLDLDIGILRSILQNSVPPCQRESLNFIETRISCYMQLYFRRLCRGTDKVEGLWQFVMKLPETSASKKNGLVCLACCWESPDGSHTIGIMRHHIGHTKDCKWCPQVTQDMLDRLKSVEPLRNLKSLEDIRKKYNTKRKTSVSELSAAALQAARMAMTSGSLSMVSANAAPSPKKRRAIKTSDDMYSQLLEKVAKLEGRMETDQLAPKVVNLEAKQTELETKLRQVKQISAKLKSECSAIKNKIATVIPEEVLQQSIEQSIEHRTFRFIQLRTFSMMELLVDLGQLLAD